MSQFIEPLTKPENDIAARVREATKVQLPPGPASLALSLAKSVEGKGSAARGVPALPKLEEILKLPELPKLPEPTAEEKPEVPLKPTTARSFM